MSDLRSAVVREAMTWLCTPWRHQGRVKGLGVDCGMLPLEVFEQAGLLPHVDTPVYPHDWHLHQSEERYLALVERFCDRVQDRDPLPGDVVLFKYGRCISHGGIVIEWPFIIHAYVEARAVVLDNVEVNQDLAKRVVGVWSLRKWELE